MARSGNFVLGDSLKAGRSVTRRNNAIPFWRRKKRRRRRSMGWWDRFRRTTVYMYVRLFVTFVLVPIPAILVSEAVAYLGLYFGPDQTSSDCSVSRIIDGDTVALWCSTPGSNRGRIAGIDSPELFSPQCASEAAAAFEARWALQNILWSADNLKVSTTGVDRFDRRLIMILADGENVAESMVAKGHARRYDGGQRAGWCG